jgi:hypothetical protein
MRVSREAIYQALFVRGGGALRRELTACLRTGRALGVPRARARARAEHFLTAEILIRQRPAEAADRAVPDHGKRDLILGLGSSDGPTASATAPTTTTATPHWLEHYTNADPTAHSTAPRRPAELTTSREQDN